MSLIESSHTIYTTKNRERLVQEIHKVLKDNVGLFEKNGIYYFDESCSGVGIYFRDDISIKFNITNGQKTNTINTNYSDNIDHTIYFQKGKNSEAYYILFDETSDILSGIIAGKTDQGNWGILLMDTVFFSENMFNMSLSALTSNTSLFSMVKMPTLKESENFISIYKVLSAPVFDKHGTLIYDGEKIYRVVSVDTKADQPCIAFEVADD